MHKYMMVALVLAAPVYGQEQATDLRTAAGCGPAKTQFTVKTDSTQHGLKQPEEGKAIVHVAVEETSVPNQLQIGDVTTRVGLDGNWVGANHGRSYISFAAEPGDHHVCTDWQSAFESLQRLSGAADFRAEAGKTYYFRVHVTVGGKEQGAKLSLMPVDAAEGMLLISKAAASTWKAKK
jgi:hypothetical protein